MNSKTQPNKYLFFKTNQFLSDFLQGPNHTCLIIDK